MSDPQGCPGRRDLTRRLGRVLDVAVRAVDELGPSRATQDGDPPGHTPAVAPSKVVAEAAMLLHAVAPLRDDPALRRGTDALLGRLLVHARSDDVLAAICLDPAAARDHVVPHAVLTWQGHDDARVERLLRQSLDLGPGFGPERLPHRALEQQWVDRLLGREVPAGDEAALLARSGLGLHLDVLGCGALDAYALTHAVLYASDFGARRPPLPRPARRVAADAEAALAVALEADNLDLAAELLWTWPMLAVPWSAAAARVLPLLLAAEDEQGVLPAPSPAAARRGLAGCYHGALAMGFLYTAALRPGRAPAAPPDGGTGRGTGDAAAALAALLPVRDPEPRWRSALRRLPPGAREAAAPLVLVAALRAARAAGDLALVARALELAVDHGLAGSPAAVQGAALLRRAATLVPSQG